MFVHVHVVVKHALVAPFASFTLAYTVILHGSSIVYAYVAVVEYALTIVHPQLHV